MQTRKEYIRPAMAQVAIQSNRVVADVCWGEGSSGSSPLHYYDTQGHGFVKFRVNTPSCKEWDGQLNYREYTCSRVEEGIYSSVSECPDWSSQLESSALAEFGEAFDTYYASVSNHGSSAKGFSDTFPPDHHGMS